MPWAIYFYEISNLSMVLPLCNGLACFKNVNNCFNTNISFYLEVSGGQNCNLYLNVVHFSTPVLIRQLWQFKIVVFLHRSLLLSLLLLLPTFFSHLSFCLFTLCLFQGTCLNMVAAWWTWGAEAGEIFPQVIIFFIFSITFSNLWQLTFIKSFWHNF